VFRRTGPRLWLPALALATVSSLAVSGVLPGRADTTVRVPTSARPADRVDTAATAAEHRAARKRACRPAFATGVDDEPWRGAARQRSERVFQARIAREHPAYVSGKGGWKFFTDRHDDNFSQALGRVTLSAKQRQAWARWLRASRRTVERAGGRYFVVVAPANWDIYARKLPRWAGRLRGTTSLQTMMREHPGLPWIDTRGALREAAKQHATYEPLNSHWTYYGGYVAWQAITRCVRATAADGRFEAVRVPEITGVGVTAGGNEFGADGVPDGPPRNTYPVYAEEHPPTTVTHLPDGAPIPNRPDHATDTLATPLRTETPAAQAPDLTLLTLRDSMGGALSPLWSTSFGTTVQYAHGINQMGFAPPDLASLVATHRPDLVLFVVTERWLSRRPPR
jgi:hypothetical protein